MLQTKCLRLTPTTLELIEAEIADRGQFARLLRAEVPDNWPPETLIDALPWFHEQLQRNPGAAGWFGWYVLRVSDTSKKPILVGGGGFKGPPSDAGEVEIGYSVLPQFQKRGIATEMVAVLVAWAFRGDLVNRIIAETTLDNTPSIKTLTNNGFAPLGAAAPTGEVKFRLERSEFAGGH